jgi:hypothetical protein
VPPLSINPNPVSFRSRSSRISNAVGSLFWPCCAATASQYTVQTQSLQPLPQQSFSPGSTMRGCTSGLSSGVFDEEGGVSGGGPGSLSVWSLSVWSLCWLHGVVVTNLTFRRTCFSDRKRFLRCAARRILSMVIFYVAHSTRERSRQGGSDGGREDFNNHHSEFKI